MGIGHLLRPHLEKLNRDASSGKLPGRLRTRQPAADDLNDMH